MDKIKYKGFFFFFDKISMSIKGLKNAVLLLVNLNIIGIFF